MSELVIQSGKLQGKRLTLPAKEMFVGRDEKCDLRIGSDLVSRKHCSLKSTPEGIIITDLGSQNGTYVNDIPITSPTLLREGDVIRIGSTLMSVPAAQKPKGAPVPAVPKFSDDEIADWLSDSGSHISNSDTAVLRSDSAATSTEVPIPAAKPTPAVKPPAKALSVKDEAAEVIRKHWESVKARQKKS